MSLTPKLALPYILPQQAQKHVTVNEGLRRLDALVQLAVRSASVTAEPASPLDGDCHILPAGKTGAAWGAMTNGAIAAFQDGAWSQITPREGFLAYVQDTDALLAYNGATWVSVGGGTVATTGTPAAPQFARFASATTLEGRTAAQVAADLPVMTGDAGSGGVKGLAPAPGAGDAAAGRFLRADGSWAAPAGGGGAAIADNLLINGDFQINQRAFAGGALSAGAFGHDRWKAATGGANATLSGFVVTLASGELEQVIEPAVFGFASLASTAMTISAEAPSADLTVTLGSQSGTITTGSGRRSVTLTLGAGDTGNLSFKVKRSAAGSVNFGRLKIEVGAAATAWSARSRAEELTLCQRYWQVSGPSTANLFGSNLINGAFSFIAPMRTTPTVTVRSGTNAIDRPGVASYSVTGVNAVFGQGPSGLLVQLNTDGTSLGICSVYPNALAFSAEL